MGSHVSMCPNHQLNRNTPLHTRANVAYFGTFGYELDLNRLTPEEQEEVKKQIRFMKDHRELIQFGDFYRLLSPFENNETAWMVVSPDRRQALVGWYRVLNTVNDRFTRLSLTGLDPDLCYKNSADGRLYYGDELMNAGLVTSDSSAGEPVPGMEISCDFDSRLYLLEAE
jgi:alpha-galactosidase